MERPQNFGNRISGCASPAAATLAVLLCALMVSASASLPARAQSFQLIYAFSGANDGGYPLAGLAMDAAGNLYGTSSSQYNQQNCPTGCLIVYEMSPNGTGWNFTTLFSGQNASQGSTSVGSMAFGPDGNLYGTTAYGGSAGACYPGWGCGVVFKLAQANGGWTESVLYRFTGVPNGNFPSGELAFDNAGNLYGTTSGGGSNVGCLGGGCTGNGVVYQLALSGSTESVLYAFGANRVNDGIGPAGGVVMDGGGNLYGTTVEGGDLNNGTVFRLAPNGSSWSETVLYNFHGGNDGVWPVAGVILDAAGNIYGSTEYDYRYGGAGAVFELSPSGGNWIHDVLYDFPSQSCGTPPCHLGEGPKSNFILDDAGNLYGTTAVDGLYGCGSVFKLSRDGEAWSYSSLHDFTCGLDGANPSGSLVMDRAGNLYGTASGGGVVDAYCPSGCGVIFKITP
jgi:uncharacterized repeat protein (TIGR03803 family)